MMRVAKISETYSNNSKCAEIHCYNANNFEISCIYCALITNNLEEFCKHFQKHLKSAVHGCVKLAAPEEADVEKHDSGQYEEIKVELVQAPENKGRNKFQESTESEDYILDYIKSDIPYDNVIHDSFNDKDSCNENNSSEEEHYKLEFESENELNVHETLENIKVLMYKSENVVDSGECFTNIEVELNISDNRKLRSSNEDNASLADPVETCAQTNVPCIDGFKCEYCDKTFTKKSNCTMHQQRHTGIRNFVCDVCDKSFYTNSELRNHIRWHNDERSYVCEKCGMAFRHSWVLTKHRRRYHLVQSATLPCPKCGKLFAFKDNLRNHMQTHNTEATFVCELCEDKSFTQRKLLWAHMRRHHGCVANEKFNSALKNKKL